MATGAVLLAAVTVLPRVFTPDPAVAALAGFLLLHTALSQPGSGVVFALDGVLIGAGDLRFLAAAMLGSCAVLAAGGALVLITDAGIGWLWAALHVWMACRLISLLWRFAGTGWQVTGARR